jgi:predicted Rossmann-fold nucleotide-binding protein
MPYNTAMPLRRVAVLGGTDPAARAEHFDAASQLGRLLAEQGMSVVYEGSPEGPLAALATALGAATGRSQQVTREELGQHADGFLALPGGPVALEELLDTCLAASSSGERPCGLLNAGDYFTDLLKTTADAVVERFIREAQRGRLSVQRDPAELLRAIADYRPPETRRQNS